jgi:CHAT domain-containing protein
VARAAAARNPGAGLRTRALLNLLYGDARGQALDRSISALRRAALLTDRPAPVLADLAAALIVRAERAQAPRDLLEAFEAAEGALRQEPRNPAALYNRALALDRFGVVDETAARWRAYLAVDSTSGWGREAARRLGALRSLAPRPLALADNTSAAEVARFAAAAPQEARELGMNRLLGEWGAAVLGGREDGAAALLARAGALGDAVQRQGGDASLADAVRAIRAAGHRPARDALARAHRDYGAAQALYDAGWYARAEPLFSAAAAAAGTSILRPWARLFQSTTAIHNRGAKEAGVRALRAVAAEVDPARYPALAGRIRWSLGNTLVRMDRLEVGLAEVRASARLFEGARERENEGTVFGIVATGYMTLGEPDSAYAAMHRALDLLRPYRAAVRLHSLLAVIVVPVAADGLLRPAIVLQDEGVGVAARTGNPIYRIEAGLSRARLLAAAGEVRRGLAEVDSVRRLVGAMDDSTARGWFTADLRETAGMLSLHTAPAAATRALDSAAAYYSGRTAIRRLPLLVGAAEARLSAADPRGALARLQAAIRILDARRGTTRMEPRRAAVFDAARGVVERTVLLQLAAGDAAGALALMDRARASLAPAGAPAAPHAVRAPPGTVAVEYALVADTLLAWTVRGSAVRVHRAVIDTVRLTRTVEELEARLQARAEEAELRPALALLYEWLVRPLAADLGAAETPLVIVVDGALASVPFPALFDARGARYLVEDHSLRFAVRLGGAAPADPPRAAGGVLLVADPAFDRREHPLLERLPRAGEEIGRIARAWPGAAVLAGPAATARAFTDALARAQVVHFAGHAVFDDQRPERSYMVLAPAPGAPGAVTAAELAALDLRHVRLVVLAACRTVRAGPSRAAGFTGLSGALLAAGAGGTLGSTWEVDDGLTAALMDEFHRAYAASRDAGGALRAAQLALLRSGDPARRTPAAWAGFRYTGR